MNGQFPFGNITSMQAEVYRHVHDYSDETEDANGHDHMMRGVTGPLIPMPNGSHYHCMRGITSWQDSHYHCYCVNTGPAIPASNGLHVHVYQGQTTFNLGHLHLFNKSTLSVPTMD
jgi:hypothetical protein